MKITGRSYFTGGGGADIGMMAAGVKMVDGAEWDREIAEWAESQLGSRIRVADVRALNLKSLEPTTCFHASPPCPSFSIANKNMGETENDITLGRNLAEYIEFQQPKILTLENVWGWRKSESWRIVANALNKVYGFGWDVKHINAADFGVPQTRKRMIVRAVKGAVFLPAYPPAESWVGWYSAVEDIIDTFPESQFAPWQWERMPEEYKTFVMNSTDSGVEARQKERGTGQPSATVTVKTMYKALLIEAVSYDRDVSLKKEAEPSHVIASGKGGRLSRAWLDQGQVVAITPRGLARFQSFPDWYELPEKKTLATTIIGNSVPPLMLEKIYKQLLEFAFGGKK